MAGYMMDRGLPASAARYGAGSGVGVGVGAGAGAAPSPGTTTVSVLAGLDARVDTALASLLLRKLALDSGDTGRVAAAIRYAVSPGGARVRPRLCLAVAASCNEDRPGLSDMAAAAIELLHCASLVHDDLPCFDDAATRRGQPSVHRAFGEPIAVLCGDALIVLAFEALAEGARTMPERLPGLMLILAAAAGMPHGMVAGQGRECAGSASWVGCHAEKTGSLFAAATMAGALAAGCDPAAWRVTGHLLGRAYQIADDIADVCSCASNLGKPTGQDARNARPNVVDALGLAAATNMMEALLAQALAAIPPCPGDASLRDFLAREARQFTLVSARALTP